MKALLLSLILLGGLAGAHAFAAETATPATADPEIVRSIAEKTAANRESLRTWRGSFTRTRFAGKEGEAHAAERPTEVSKFDFIYDAEGNRARWSGTIRRFASDGTGTLASEKQYGYMYDEKGVYIVEREAGVRMEIIGHIEPAGSRRSHPAEIDLDIDDMFNPGRGALIHRYENLRDFLKTPASPYYLDREGDRVAFGERNEIGVNEYVCDLSVGGNIVSFKMQGAGEGAGIMSRQYAEIDGVWVPKKVINEWRDKDGALVSKTEAVFDSMVANGPLAQDDFTLEKIGVKAGDLLQDNRKGAERPSGVWSPPAVTESDAAGDLTEADTAQAAAAMKPGESSDSPAPSPIAAPKPAAGTDGLIWAVTGLALLAVSIAIILRLRKRRK